MIRRCWVRFEYSLHRKAQWVLGLLLIIQTGLLVVPACKNGPVVDEIGHLPAGLSHLRFRRFDLYRVNPPLIRMIAAIPIFVSTDCAEDWAHYRGDSLVREEFDVGRSFVAANASHFFRYVTMGRLACIPLSLSGTLICFFWARSISGIRAGLVAASLFVFSPNMIAHGSLLTPDAGASVTGLLAAFAFWRWLRLMSWSSAICSGIALGLAILSKSTWMVLFVLWPLLYFVSRRPNFRPRSVYQPLAQLSLILAIGLYVLNAGYLFDGTLKPLGEFRFKSNALTHGEGIGANRFAGGLFHQVPIPLPKDFVLGIDQQKYDFECGQPTWLNGEWRDRGAWYYYLFAFGMKTPIGFLCLFFLATLGAIHRRCQGRSQACLFLLIPAGAVFLLVSSQTGLNKHLRYVLPAMPFVFVFIGISLAGLFAGRLATLRPCLFCFFAWGTLSSLQVWPLSLTYFNEFAGGPACGDQYLLGSNLDWGQGVRSLKRWDDHRRDDLPLFVACDGLYDPADVGVRCQPVPLSQSPLPDGWYAISVNRIHDSRQMSALFANRSPTLLIDNCIRVFRITAPADAACCSLENRLPDTD